MKLATTTADFRGYAKTIAETVRLFADTGFKHLDLNLYRENHPGSPFLAGGDGWKKIVDDAGAAAAEIGADFCQAHSPDGLLFAGKEQRDNLLLSTRRSIVACAMLGIKNIVVHAGVNPAFTSDEFKRHNRDFYRELFDALEKHGVNALIENGCETNSPHYRLRTGAEMKEFLEFVGHPLLHACWDTGHAHLRGMDQYESIITLGEDLRALHIQDNFGNCDSHTAPFCGTCNFDQVLQGLLDAGYGGAFAFEAGNLMRNHQEWPNFRQPWEHDGKTVTTLLDVPLHLKRQTVTLMHAIGKHMLEQYGCFED